MKNALGSDGLALYGRADTVADRMTREIRRLQNGIQGLSSADELTGKQLRNELRTLLIAPHPDTLAAPLRACPPNTDGTKDLKTTNTKCREVLLKKCCDENCSCHGK